MDLSRMQRSARATAASIALTTLVWAAPTAVQPSRPTAPPAKTPGAPQGRCAALTGEVIPAEKVLADLRDGKNVSLQGKTIEGSLDADTVFPEADGRRTTLRNIKGALKLDACRVTGRIALKNCVFTQEVALGCSEILGDLDLSDSELRGSLKAEHMRVSGDVSLVNTIVEGDVLLQSASLQGSLDLSGARLHRVFAMRADLGSVTGEHVLLQLVDVTNAKAGTTQLTDLLVLDSITARDTRFGRGLSFSGVRVGGTMQLGGASISGAFTLTDVKTDVDLFLPHLFEGPTTLADVVVGRNLAMENGQLEDVTIERLKVGESTKLEGGRFTGKVVIADSQLGKAFKAGQTVFTGDCEFRKVLFPGEDPLAGVVFARKPTLVDTKLLHEPTAAPDAAAADSEEPEDDDEP